MENLTMLEKVIQNHNGLEPLEGYDLVIYEKLEGSGAKFCQVLEPRGRFQRPKGGVRSIWSSKNYFAIAVNKRRELRLTFSEHFMLDDQIHEFDLLFDLNYYVSDPETVATARNEDPLRQLRGEIIRVIGHEIVKRPWEKIRNNASFRDVAQDVVSNTEDDIRTYAVTLGFGVKSIALRARLREKDLEVAMATEAEEATRGILGQKHLTEDFKREYEQRLHQEGLAHKIGLMSSQDQVDSFEQRRELRRAMTEGSSAAIRNVGAATDTPEALRDGARVLREVLYGDLSAPAHNSIEAQPEPPMLGSVGRSLPAGSEQRWIEMLTRTLTEINQWRYPFEKRRSLSSAILYLVAELLLDDRAKDETLKHYSEEIFTISRQFSPPLSAEQNSLLMHFKRYEQLRDQFK